MKPKQIMILGVILGILVLGIFLKTWVRSAENSAGSAQGSGVAIAEFEPAKVAQVSITNGTQPSPVELIKENGSWKVKSLWNAKADRARVEALLQKLHSVRGELRGSGKKLFPDFSIEDTEAFSIKFLDAGNTVLSDLRLGKKRAGEEGYFIRKAGGEEVYLVDLNMAELLGIYAGFDEAAPLSSVWADLSLFNLDPEKVTGITISVTSGEQKKMSAGLARATDPKEPLINTWKFRRENISLVPDPDKVLRFIAVMNSIRATQIVDPGGKGYGLEKPVWQLAVTENGEEKILFAGPKDEKAELYYVKPSWDPTVFGLSVSYFADLNVDDTHFVKEAPAATAAVPGKGPEEPEVKG